MSTARQDASVIEVDLGDEPPLLTVDSRGLPDRRRVSLRWLTGTVLASVASTFLMGGALYAAFDGRDRWSEPADVLPRTASAQSPELPDDLVEKGDLMLPELATEPAKQILKVSTIAREGERDVIRLKPFAKVSTPLVSDAAAIVDPIPRYDPLRIFADANADTATDSEATLYGAAIDSEMSVKVTDFPVDDPGLTAEIPLDIPQTERVVREAAQFLNGTNVQLASLPLVDPARFDFGFGEQSALDQLGVRVVPENVSFVPTSVETSAPAEAASVENRKVAVDSDTSLDQVLTDNEATDDEAGDIMLAFHKADRLRILKAGDEVHIRLAPDEEDETGRYRPVLVSVYRNGEHLGSVGLGDDGRYVPSDEALSDQEIADSDGDDARPRPRLYESLYQTALSNGIPPELIDELMRIYSFDLDFNTRVQPGDSFQVVYTMDSDGEEQNVADDEIVYTAITLGGKERRFYRYRAPDDGSLDYYDADGKSAKKFLLRKPMSGGTFRSGFGARNHPLLGVTKMHTGVDWASPRGTPIMAAGDGIVTYAKWKNGYGNYIEIQHTNGYATAYAHQTGFAKGIKEGIRVRQGQIIGYVGTTGLSTGPHLHYEVHVNGKPVDPLRIKLPQGRTLDGDVLTAFETERERVDTLLGDRNQSAKFAAATDAGGG